MWRPPGPAPRPAAAAGAAGGGTGAAAERLALLTIAFDDPAGYGRVVRAPAGADGAEGRVLSIIEHKDATEGQRAIREVYSGVIAAPAHLLRGWLAQGRRLLWFNRAMALLLVLTAAWMVRA